MINLHPWQPPPPQGHLELRRGGGVKGQIWVFWSSINRLQGKLFNRIHKLWFWPMYYIKDFGQKECHLYIGPPTFTKVDLLTLKCIFNQNFFTKYPLLFLDQGVWTIENRPSNKCKRCGCRAGQRPAWVQCWTPTFFWKSLCGKPHWHDVEGKFICFVWLFFVKALLPSHNADASLKNCWASFYNSVAKMFLLPCVRKTTFSLRVN